VLLRLALCLSLLVPVALVRVAILLSLLAALLPLMALAATWC
jgi:hypothetical protein